MDNVAANVDNNVLKIRAVCRRRQVGKDLNLTKMFRALVERN